MITISCQKDYFEDGGLADAKLGVSTYDFIKSRPDQFEKIQWIIDHHNLQDLVNKSNTTFFIPESKSVETYLTIKEQETVQLDKLPDVYKDTLGMYIKKYMFDSKIMREDLSTKIEDVIALSGDTLGVSLMESYFKGVEGFGPKYLMLSSPLKEFVDENTGKKRTFRYNVTVKTSNLESTNGAVHVLEPGHVFGFGSN